MKLFALAAAISANSFKRTDHPAPGIINEQGGYWADIQYNPENGQAPQISFQKKICCKNYKWYPYLTDPGVEIWLHQMGEYRQMPYYKGEKDGETVYAWMNYQGSDDYWLGNVKSAHWIISKELGSYEGSSPDNELISDYSGDNQQHVSLPRCIDEASIWHNRFNCAHPQWGSNGLPKIPIGVSNKIFTANQNVKVKSCQDLNKWSRMGIFWRQNNIRVCNLSQLLTMAIEPQFEQARYAMEIDKTKHDEMSDLRTAWTTIQDRWRELADSTKCGFERSKKNPVNGFIDRCEWMCRAIKHTEDYTSGDHMYMMVGPLHTMISYTTTYFGSNHINYNESEDQWYINDDLECGQKISDIYRNIKVFEPYLPEGSLSNFPPFKWNERKKW